MQAYVHHGKFMQQVNPENSEKKTVLSNSENHLVSAPLWRRLAAMIYDSFLLFSIWMVVGFAVLWSFGIDQIHSSEVDQIVLNPLIKWVLFSAMLTSTWLFFGFFWTHSGQTLGMQAWRIRVLTLNGDPLNWRQSTLRILCSPVSMLLLGVGYWWALAHPDGHSWPDLISNTAIYRAPA